MSSAAVRSAVTRRQIAPRQRAAARRVRVVNRPRKRRLRYGTPALLLAAIVSVYAYVAVYASMTATSFDRSRMCSELKLEKIKNERLRIDYARRLSPASAMATGQNIGMVYAKEYDYLSKPNTVARADQDR